MLFSLIGTFLVGATVGVFIWAGYRAVGRKVPGYLIPMAVGVSILGYTIWNEYSWFGRTMDGMPPEVKLVKTYPESKPWAPWTYIVPRVSRFVAIDMAKARTNPKLPSYVIVETLLVKRDGSAVKVQQMVDCGRYRFADLPANPTFGDDGQPQGVQWAPEDDFPELITAVCIGR